MISAAAGTSPCRIADTIEDEPTLSAGQKQAFAERFVEVVGGRGSVGASKSFREQREALFQPRDFALLGNCQAICLPYDGVQSLPPRRVYLKPHYLPADLPYWTAKETGQL